MALVAARLQFSGCTVGKAHEDPPPQTFSADSPFLRLPAELRNRIYELVLTSTEKRLRFADDGPCGKPRIYEPFPRFSKRDFNQLKYVCRELYQETAGLEAKFNILEITGGQWPKPGPARIFNKFLRGCAPAKRRWFVKVILRQRHSGHSFMEIIEPASDVLPIADFCRQYPHVKVAYLVEGFEYKLYSVRRFIKAGYFITMAVRGRNLFNEQQSQLLPQVTLARRWTNEQGIARMKVPNLRIWPAVEDDVCFAALLPQGSVLSRWVGLMQKWAKVGI
ncbi:hypothetical protein BDW02DRAFT_70361 [Decorospora gaudefroyi]|uniref:F-box domain-containing protein n=1 Tax=Decorospora gaudefroyi TaxID=184978 RepID=A0A6A5K0G5_9PLEO|nr:hypothetical protein BDW02DRAFT_70361 [Decorospora gaudefroyi]